MRRRSAERAQWSAEELVGAVEAAGLAERKITSPKLRLFLASVGHDRLDLIVARSKVALSNAGIAIHAAQPAERDDDDKDDE